VHAAPAHFELLNDEEAYGLDLHFIIHAPNELFA